jgi:hypothetical protein
MLRNQKIEQCRRPDFFLVTEKKLSFKAEFRVFFRGAEVRGSPLAILVCIWIEFIFIFIFHMSFRGEKVRGRQLVIPVCMIFFFA